MSVVMEADPEDVSEVVRNLEDAVEAVLLPKTKVVIANEADDSVQAVADSVGGATRRRGSEAAEAVHQGARVPQRDNAKEKPVIFIILLLKSARTLTGRVKRKVHCFIAYFCL